MTYWGKLEPEICSDAVGLQKGFYGRGWAVCTVHCAGCQAKMFK